jgi:hypothetical protein
MSTDIDWQHELDSSFGTGNDVEVARYVAAGHRAVRRRRLAAVGAGLGAAAVIAGIVWTTAPGGTSRTSDVPIATRSPTGSPTGSPTESPRTTSPDGPLRDQPWRAGEPPARATPDGLQVRDGAVVHERRDDVYPGKATESAALDISHDGERYWLVLEWDAGGSGMSSTRPEDGLFDSFDAFIRAEVAGGGMTSPTVDDPQYMYADLVNWSGGEPELRPGATLVRAVQDPIETKKDSIALAVRHEGEVTWMILMRNRNGWGASHETAARSGWPTFDLWISEQVALQTGETGLRLVELDVDGTVSPALPDVEVLDQRADPDLAAYGTDAATTSAVALVDWRDERWFVLALIHPDQDTVITFAASKADGAETLDDFLAFAAARSDEGGLR